MIDSGSSDVSIDQLIQTIQQEAMRRKTFGLMESNNPNTLRLRRAVDNVGVLLTHAEVRAQVRTKLPNKFDRFPFKALKGLGKLALKSLEILFRDQRVINCSLVQASRESLAIERQTIEQLVDLQSQLNGLDERLETMEERLQMIEERLLPLQGKAPAVEQLSLLENQQQQFEQQLQQSKTQTSEQINGLGEYVRGLSEQLKALEAERRRNDSYLKMDLGQQKRLLQLLLEKMYPSADSIEQPTRPSDVAQEADRLLDTLYLAFEDQFRGDPADISARLGVYLPYLETARVGTTEAPILDLGSGRGEWLELLQRSGYTARGIDQNQALLEHCTSKGLTVEAGDALTYLRNLPEASLGAVTAFHLIEHLPMPILVQLLAEILRVLQPGGLVVLETPNPANLQVGANTFYLDPTHQRPLPSPLVKFLAEYSGFSTVEIVPLHPCPEWEAGQQERTSDSALSHHIYGPQDYALIGRKP